MPSNLAAHLQTALLADPPKGWIAVGREQRVLQPDTATALGFNPAADLAIENKATKQKLWLELEISRADPVANHAKFAVAHLAQGPKSSPAAIFVSMMSPHIATGRRRLGAHTISAMRRLDMLAYQTVLFPQLTGPEIKELNHMPLVVLERECPPVAPEWDRVLRVANPIACADGHAILYVGDPAEVRWNIFAWNRAVESTDGALLWGGLRGHRTVQHYVWSPTTKLFAPSKFAAYVPADGDLGMTMKRYVTLDESESRFDGHLAWKHLERIGFTRTEDSAAMADFRAWFAGRAENLRVRGGTPVLWQPPSWAR